MREKREKAIKFFQDMQECTYGNLEEVDMAIHALEQERNVIEELENLKADMNENLCPTTCEDCQFYDSHFYAKSGCRVTDFIDRHIAKIKGENE